MNRIGRAALATAAAGVLAALLVGAASGSGSAPSRHQTRHRAHHALHAHRARTVSTVPSNFVSPVHVSTTFEGCNNDGTVTLPNGSGLFVCPDADYTTGNLGKHWNELDLVPFRLITTSGNQASATTDYNVIVAGDYKLNGFTGWDVVGGGGAGGAPTVNPSIQTGPNSTLSSDASCSVTANAQDVGPGITGGADSSIYRVLSIHQNKGTTCIFDYYMRLALGAHNYPGSSLQAYIFTASDFNGGKSTIPLPVAPIQPQSASKTMTATENSSTPWNLTKGATPASVNYGNVCDNTFSSTQNVAVTVTWTKLTAVPSGQVLLVTNVYATNPSARTITTTVSDQMYQGTDQSTPLGSPFVVTKDVPPNTASYLMETDTQTVTSSATQFNDVATATYTDLITGVPVPGNTTASASATVTNGTTLNSSATVTDSESITGTGLTFKVGTPSFGSFTNYTAGTYTTGPVNWTSGTNAITGSGSVVFSKTIKLGSLIATSGALSDTATLNGSDGFGPITAPLKVNISSTATTTLTIDKTIPQALLSPQTFQFHVYDAGSNDVADPTVTIPAGSTSNAATVPGLALASGPYSVTEDTGTGWDAQAAKTNVSGCNPTVTFHNTFAKATAFASKVTLPSGYESGWTFTLTRPDSSTLTGTTDSSGDVIWSGGSSTSTALGQEGTYTISETSQANWQEVGAAQAAGSTGTVTGGSGTGASCSFTVSYPADAGQAFGCTITNQGLGNIIVKKVTNPSGASQSFTFVPSWGSNFNLTDGGSHDSGPLDAGSYSVSENSTTGWTLTSATCDNGDAPSAITLNPGDTVTCTFTNTQQAQIVVKKVTNPSGASQSFTFTPTGWNSGNTFNLSDGQSFTSGYLAPGSGYAVSEGATTGWDLTSAVCDGTGNTPASITLDPGQVVTCTFTNTERGNLVVKKVTDPSPDPSGSSFGFSASGGSIGSDTFSLSNGGTKTYANVTPTSGYAVSEGSLTGTGWSLQSATCDNGNAVSAITINPGQTVTCTFTNVSRGFVRLVKTINGSPITGSQSFQFELRQGDQSTTSTSALETLFANSTNGGTLNFATALVPGQTYALCELLVAGYGPSISGYGAYNPGDNPNYWCFDFTITVAQAANTPSVTFNVDNSHQFTKALTIGYWKNWSACKNSKGKQTDQLGLYLGGIQLGTVTFNQPSPWECQAVQTLSKNTFSGQKMASDPLFNMAAQLLAADLNVGSGAGVCSAAAAAIASAQSLLVTYGWNGNTYSPALTSADAALANSLAATLDQYNNNNLC